MIAVSKYSAKYNRRAAIIKSIRAVRSEKEIIRFFGFPRSTVYEDAAKFNRLEKSNKGLATPTRKFNSKRRPVRTPEVIKKAQDLIFEDHGSQFESCRIFSV